MKSELQNHKLSPLNPPRPVSLFLLLATLTLTACNNQQETSNNSSQESNIALQTPDAILGLRLDQTAGTLTAAISGCPGTTQMTIVLDTATAACTGVPTGSRTITITFTYDLALFGPLVVATASKLINVTQGNNLVTFVATDYDTDSHDEDGDGISNILELDEFSTTSPVSCTLGVAARLGTCELGT